MNATTTNSGVTEILAASYTEECPIHGGEVKKEYTFGRYEDATLYTHHGCKCCVLITRDLGETENEIALLGNYNDLAGTATLYKLMQNAKCR
jgi:hypothetical protein